MQFKKEGFPAASEIVLCTVKKILHNSVFVTLDEYKDREGIIHISEIAPGRIRTIREYVREGKKIICMVLRINTERNHIELSLRRVTTSVRIKKNEGLKLEQKSEKILEIVAQSLKMPFAAFYKDVGMKIIDKYGSLHACFRQLAVEPSLFNDISIDKKIAKEIVELVVARFKPPEIRIIKNLSIKCRLPNGVEIIKESLMNALKVAENKKYRVSFSYLGAPNYRVTVVGNDYKAAQAVIDEVAGMIIKDMKAHEGEAELSK